MEKVIKNQFLTGERALFGTKDAEIYDTIFTDGESPLKESSNIGVYGSMFKWKYPLWYCRNISVRDSAWFDMARAGVWYTDNISRLCHLLHKYQHEKIKNLRKIWDFLLTNSI